MSTARQKTRLLVDEDEEKSTASFDKRLLKEMRLIGAKGETYNSVLERLILTYKQSSRKVLPR